MEQGIREGRSLALDEPGSAGPSTWRNARYFAVVVASLTLVVLFIGRLPLQHVPEFANFHASVIMIVDAITAALVYGQFSYRRRESYVWLAAGYLFSALIAIPFLLTFPGALRDVEPLWGGTQSSIWIWHLWHLIFPIFVAVALLLDRVPSRELFPEEAAPLIRSSVFLVFTLVALITLAVTVFHRHLPVLITVERIPLTSAFYVVGSTVVAVTFAALLMALFLARRRSVLHLWLAMVLFAFLADGLISLGAFARYTLAWYAGRFESMFAASALLFVFINELNRTYSQLGQAMRELFAANSMLSSLLDDKDRLVQQLRRSEEQVRNMAYQDAVTGLPNRRLAMERVEHELQQAARYGHGVAVLFLDVDLFKEINDRFGHETGDLLLREVGKKMGSCIRVGDTVARFGGDEFMIMLPEIESQEDAIAVARKLIDSFKQPVEALGNAIHVTTSIGVAVCQGRACISANELVRRADQAMYEAKRAGRNRFCL